MVFNGIIVPIDEYTLFTLERSSIMSIVRYTNKKTGVVTLYESTSHYDPVTKQSRPIRKYLGKLDPETGELIPSTKRKKKKPQLRRHPRQIWDYRQLWRKKQESAKIWNGASVNWRIR